MLKVLVLVGAFLVVSSEAQQDVDYFYDYIDTPNLQQAAARPAPPPPPPPRARTRPQSIPQAVRIDEVIPDGPTTTPVPILRDSRRIDVKTGAFVYEYAGADGSSKYEYRYTNGTVIGNYTFINDLGEKETRQYSAGVHDPTLVDETTGANYVDLGNYELYKHLERPYIHDDGTPGFVEEVIPAPPPRRPSGAPRKSAPRPVARPPPPPPPAPIPQSFDQGSAHFNRPSPSAPVFDYEDLAVAGPPPPPPPPPRAAPRPASRRRPQGPPRPPHRFDLSNTAGQSSDAILDSLIRRFQ